MSSSKPFRPIQPRLPVSVATSTTSNLTSDATVTDAFKRNPSRRSSLSSNSTRNPSTTSLGRRFAGAHVSNGCLVPHCPLQPICSLRSHRHYSVKRLYRNDSSITINELTLGDKFLVKIEESSPSAIIGGGIETIHSLPSEITDNATFKELYRDFVTTVYDRFNVLLEPPSCFRSRDEYTIHEKQGAHVSSMSTSVGFLNSIAATHFYTCRMKANREAYRKTETMIYAQLLELFRRELADYKPQYEYSDRLILIVLTIVLFDVNAGRLAALQSHRQAMIDLVRHSGGLYNLGRKIPYVMTLDRILTTFTGMPCVYSTLIPLQNEIQRAPQHAAVYGKWLDDANTRLGIHPEILIYCDQTCRAIEILEGEHWFFDPNNPNSSSEIHYLYYLRDRLATRFVHLHAQQWQHVTPDRCVLLSTRIIDYSVLMDNYMARTTLFLADKTKEIIQQQDIAVCWAGSESLLIWILFVLLCVPNESWEGRRWALLMVEEQLTMRYGENVWPNDWMDSELASVRCLVWSDTRMGDAFRETCSEIATLHSSVHQ